MRASTLTIILAFFHTAVFSLAIPTNPSTSVLTPRSGNDPSTIADTPSPLTQSIPSSLSPRHGTNTIVQHAPNSRTYILITSIRAVAGPAILNLLAEAQRNLQTRLIEHGDALLRSGQFDWLGEGWNEVHVRNSNNHQLTYGVLAAALGALRDWMAGEGGRVGEVEFVVYDGTNEVGMGAVGLEIHLQALGIF